MAWFETQFKLRDTLDAETFCLSATQELANLPEGKIKAEWQAIKAKDSSAFMDSWQANNHKSDWSDKDLRMRRKEKASTEVTPTAGLFRRLALTE